ncbi:rhox homeobox family member 1-like [Sigmodon hispidus]
MANQFQHVDPNFYKLAEIEVEVGIDDEQEATAEAESSSGSDNPNNQGIPDHKDDVIRVVNFNSVGDNIKQESYGGYQCDVHLQVEDQGNLAAARVPRFRRTRPRIQLGLTPRQLNELEDVFEKTKYPDETTRRDLAKRLFLGESIVRVSKSERGTGIQDMDRFLVAIIKS